MCSCEHASTAWTSFQPFRAPSFAAPTSDLFTMGLKEFRVSVNVPEELKPLVKQRVKEEGYPSDSAYFVGLLLFDLISRYQHKLTSQMMNEPAEILDKIVDEIVRDFDNAPRGTGDWLRIR